MQNPLYLYVPGYLTTLSRHFGSPETTLVRSEVSVGNNASQRRVKLIPDLIVTFGINAQHVLDQGGTPLTTTGNLLTLSWKSLFTTPTEMTYAQREKAIRPSVSPNTGDMMVRVANGIHSPWQVTGSWKEHTSLFQ